MKKLPIIIILSLFCLKSYTQDTIRLTHKNYISVFSKSKRYPILVEWWDTKPKLQCTTPLKRKDKFAADPLLPNETNIANDYVGSGFDRGHMCPAADNLCQTQEIQDECFYFSNMVPQPHSLNAGDWKSLETFTRESINRNDSIHIWCGAIGEVKKIGSISIPKTCWKVVFYKTEKIKKAYIFNNDSSKPDGYENNEVKIEEIQKLTGFKFN